jgi:hypothetical protein
MTATAFVGCGGKDNTSSTADSSSSAESSAEESKAEESSAEESAEDSATEESSAEGGESSAPAGAPTPDGTLGDDDATLSILCWTDTDLNSLFKVTSAQGATYVNVGSNGTEANEQYSQYFSSGSDVDLFVCDADWVMSYENNDEYTAPLSALGIDESMYGDAYQYTVAMGKDNNGVLKGASWQAAAGGYCYRADLAETYLGVTSPEDMQKKVGSWDDFWATAKEVYEASGQKTAMADTLAGVWRAYSAGNRTTPWVVDGKFDPKATEAFIGMAKTNFDAGYITGVGQWTDDWALLGQSDGALADGTFGFFFPSWAIAKGGQLESAEGGEGGSTYGKYSICAGPAGWYWGGSWLCVSPNCNSATAAAQFLYDTTINAETMKSYALEHGDFVNNKPAMEEIISEGSNKNPLLGDADQFAALADSAAAIKLDGIAGMYDGTINDAFVNAVDAYCKGDLADEQATLDKFLDDVAAALPDVTVE